MTVRTTKPFGAKETPPELTIPERVLRVLFLLRSDDPDDKDRSMLYSSSPLEGTNGFYVVGLDKRIPSQVQPLSAVHDKVVADLRFSEALEKARAAGDKFESALQAGMNQGKTFDTMCAAQFVHPQRLKPFTLTPPSAPDLTDKVLAAQIQELAGRMHQGQATPFVPTPEGGFLLYVKGRLPVDEAALKRDLPAYTDRMRERLQIAAFQEWFSREYSTRFTPPPGEQAAAGG